MKKGDLITAYHSGIHKVVNIQERWNDKRNVMLPVHYEYNENCGDKIGDLITYVKVADINGKPINSTKELSCDKFFCKPLSVYIEDLEKRLNKLKNL